MPGTIAVFGAGSGLGASVAERFGREGYRVALVARREERLRQIQAGLESSGLEATVFTGDLSDPAGAPRLVETIEETLGPIDVMHYGPLSGNQRFFPARDVDVTTQQRLLDLFFLTPIALIQAILPGMLQRHEGGILVSQGSTAIDPLPGMSGVGPAMAATRNYVRALFAELVGTGVYAGTLTIRVGIDRSEMHALMRSRRGGEPSPPAADPDELAELVWTMLARRDGAEAEFPVGRPEGG
jgi:short-subunit dehydrogenase